MEHHIKSDKFVRFKRDTPKNIKQLLFSDIFTIDFHRLTITAKSPDFHHESGHVA